MLRSSPDKAAVVCFAGPDSLSDARKAMRKQKAFGGKLPAGVTPSFLVVGPELETDAEKILATLSATTANDVNAY